jgi:hypothetical protein
MTAPPKTNRKLRKERKNRSKKVRVSVELPFCWCLILAPFIVPWHQKVQGRRTSQEGQVKVARLSSFLGVGGSVSAICHFAFLHTTIISKSRHATVSYPYARSLLLSLLMNFMRMRNTMNPTLI